MAPSKTTGDGEGVLRTILLALASPTEDAIDELLGCPRAFAVDHRSWEEEIVTDCERCLRTGRLTPELRDDGLYIRYGSRVARAPLEETMGDRHIALLTLNEVLAPDYEVKLCLDSLEYDSLGRYTRNLFEYIDCPANRVKWGRPPDRLAVRLATVGEAEPAPPSSPPEPAPRRAARVRHRKFGDGEIVRELEGDKVEVRFPEGSRLLVRSSLELVPPDTGD